MILTQNGYKNLRAIERSLKQTSRIVTIINEDRLLKDRLENFTLIGLFAIITVLIFSLGDYASASMHYALFGWSVFGSILSTLLLHGVIFDGAIEFLIEKLIGDVF